MAIPEGPFGIKNLDLLILEKTEKLIQVEKRNPNIKLFHVNYKEIKSTKSGYRMFHIINGANQFDK